MCDADWLTGSLSAWLMLWYLFGVVVAGLMAGFTPGRGVEPEARWKS